MGRIFGCTLSNVILTSLNESAFPSRYLGRQVLHAVGVDASCDTVCLRTSSAMSRTDSRLFLLRSPPPPVRRQDVRVQSVMPAKYSPILQSFSSWRARLSRSASAINRPRSWSFIGHEEPSWLNAKSSQANSSHVR